MRGTRYAARTWTGVPPPTVCRHLSHAEWQDGKKCPDEII